MRLCGNQVNISSRVRRLIQQKVQENFCVAAKCNDGGPQRFRAASGALLVFR